MDGGRGRLGPTRSGAEGSGPGQAHPRGSGRTVWTPSSQQGKQQAHTHGHPEAVPPPTGAFPILLARLSLEKPSSRRPVAPLGRPHALRSISSSGGGPGVRRKFPGYLPSLMEERQPDGSSEGDTGLRGPAGACEELRDSTWSSEPPSPRPGPVPTRQRPGLSTDAVGLLTGTKGATSLNSRATGFECGASGKC